jgi:2,4-dienoyl-CoA reductase-like NADH-dependent reductase (Old Yellow Enzyme family)
MKITKVAQLSDAQKFRAHLAQIGADIPFENEVERAPQSPLAQQLDTPIKRIGNRFSILPMEGWDGETDGKPSDLTRRRWRRFGLSGAKLIWGGEAVAVRPDARANPNQLVASEDNLASLAELREILIAEHYAHYDNTDDLLIGLQLTHSGRFSRPHSKKLEPRIAYRHPVLDRKFGIATDYPVLSDADIDEIIEDVGKAARLAQRAGYEFVDLKHCHGYLGHELLSAVDRDGKYGGCFENRVRYLRNMVAAVRANAPHMGIGVRLSAADMAPFKPNNSDRTGEMDWVAGQPYRFAFGGDGTGAGFDVRETLQFLDVMHSLDIRMICITVGSPYYNPHIQRPAAFPPSDGYQPPEDPLMGVARQIQLVAQLKRARPDMIFVGSGYSYLQDWLVNVAQAVLRANMTDVVGIGRMALSYPQIFADALDGKAQDRKHVCRTFSDCTTAPRNGLVSGCYPLDEFYKTHSHKAQLDEAKKSM